MSTQKILNWNNAETFLILSMQLSASLCSWLNGINNVSQWTLLSLWATLTHGCASRHTAIIFTSLVFYTLLSLWIILSFFLASSHLSLFPQLSPQQCRLQCSADCLSPTLFLTLILSSLSPTILLSSVWHEHMYNAWWRESCEKTCLCQ